MLYPFLNVFAALIFLFIFWKKLKEDYASEIIFSTSTFILVGILTGFLLSSKFFPVWFFWSEFLGAGSGLLYGIWRFKIRPYEAVEGCVISLFPWLAYLFVKDSVVNSSIISFAAFLVILALIFTYFFLDMRYKSFAWYKSGRAGFSGLATLGLFFLTRSTLAIFFHDVLSFTGKYEAYISGSFAFLVFLLVFNLSRQEA